MIQVADRPYLLVHENQDEPLLLTSEGVRNILNSYAMENSNHPSIVKFSPNKIIYKSYGDRQVSIIPATLGGGNCFND